MAFNIYNSRKSSVTAESIKAHEELIKTAKDDLGARLEILDEKMELILEKTTDDPNSDETELQRLKAERLSTEKCLEICTQLSQHIGEIVLLKNRNASSASEDDPTAFPERVVSEGLQECRDSLNTTTAKLGEHMNSVWERLLAKSKTVLTSEEEIEELAKLKDQWETTRQCIDICSKADRRMRENVSNIVNHSTGDAVQFMVSTDGNIINGTNKGLGWRSRQVGGHLNDATVQQISRDFASLYLRHPEDVTATPHTASSAQNADESSYEFTQRYGRGSKLSPKSTPQGSMASARLAEGCHNSPQIRGGT